MTICEVELPLTTGGMGGEAVTFYCCLAELLSKCSTMTFLLASLLVVFRSETIFIRVSHSISYRSPDDSSEVGLISGPRNF